MAGQTRIDGNLIDTGTDPQDILSVSTGDGRYVKPENLPVFSGGNAIDFSNGTIDHSDTSSQSSVSNSGSDVIQSVTLDDFGHVTGLSSTSISAGGVGTRVRLNGSGTFTVPAGIEKIRVFIVGGGGGGASRDANLARDDGAPGGTSSFGGFSAGGGGGSDTGLGGAGGGSGCRGNHAHYSGNEETLGGGSGGFGGNGGPSNSEGIDGGGGASYAGLAGGGGGLNVQDINTSPGATFSYVSGSGGARGVGPEVIGGDGGDGFIVVEY